MEYEKDVNYVGQLPPGDYYLGDPFYVIDDELWGDFCNHLSNSRDENICQNGMIFEFQGHTVFVTSTNCGDGVYEDQLGNRYGVDAGIIGLIPVDLCKKDHGKLGHKFEAHSHPIDVAVTRGRWIDCKKIYVGARVIET